MSQLENTDWEKSAWVHSLLFRSAKVRPRNSHTKPMSRHVHRFFRPLFPQNSSVPVYMSASEEICLLFNLPAKWWPQVKMWWCFSWKEQQFFPLPDDHTIRTTDTPGFKPFIMFEKKNDLTYMKMRQNCYLGSDGCYIVGIALSLLSRTILLWGEYRLAF